MERSQDKLEKYSIIFLIVMYTVGVVGHSVSATLNLMQQLTPFTLLLTGGVVFYNVIKNSKPNFILWGVIVYLVTLTLEIAGVKTGLIFGVYNYGNVLGFKLFETPLIIGLNWMFVILGAIKIAQEFGKSNLVIILTSGMLAVVFDLILEPVAIGLNYWQWSGSVIPVQNFIAWFLISVFAAWLFISLKIEIHSKVPKFYFYIQLIFFVLLNVTVVL